MQAGRPKRPGRDHEGHQTFDHRCLDRTVARRFRPGDRDGAGAEMDVTLEVHARVAQGIADDVVRTVSENANALRFDHASFERE